MSDYTQWPSPNYREGRIKPVRMVVIHTAETPCESGRAMATARYLARPDKQASAHYCVDPGQTVQGVQETDTAWAAPGGNADGIQIEQAAYAAFTAAYWALPLPQQMIVEQLVPLVAGICRRWQLPAVALDTAAVAAGARGITTHVCVSEAFGLSDHWDCGHHYPLGDVVARVAALLDPTPQPNPTPIPYEEYEMRACRMNDGQVILVDGGEFRVLTGTWPVINAQLIELANAGLIPSATLTPIGDNAVQALRLVP